jgi:hypothetical protein
MTPLFFLFACSGATLGTDADSGLVTDTLTDTGATDTGATDTGDGSLGWRVHDTLGTLVYATWTQADATTGYVEYSFDDGVWLQSPERDIAAGAQEQLLLGIPYETQVTLRLVTPAGTSAEVVAETADEPLGLPVPELVSTDPSQHDPGGRYYFTSINGDSGGWTGGDYWKLIIDRQGRIVWAQVTPSEHWTIWVGPSKNGVDLMWDEATVWVWSTEQESQVHRVKIDGTVVESVETPGLHHAWDELSDGTLIWGSYRNSNEEWLERRSPDGATETVWKCSEFEVEQQGETGRSCHSNSWWWDAASDTYLVSFPSSAGDVKDTVLHVDNAGATLSTWGQLSDWSFDEPAHTFDYQHGVTFTPDGNLLVSSKLHESNPFYERSNDTLAVREYRLDYDTQTLHEVWSFGEDQGIAGNTAGEAHRLPSGNTLHNYGSGARTREITASGDLVWDLKWADGDTEGRGRLQGRGTWLADLYDFAP